VIRVSPISVTRFFSDKGIQVLKSEWVWVWIPSLAVILISRLIRRWYPGLK
jgi:inner membrane protein